MEDKHETIILFEKVKSLGLIGKDEPDIQFILLV
jgi:hypothetical protein